MGTKIKIYQGNQIGGCVVSIETLKTKICIDFGKNLPGNEEKEKIDIKGLNKKGEKLYDALFFSHYHSDHVGRMEEVLNGVRMFIGETSKKVMLEINRTIKNKKMCEILENRVETYTENIPIKIGEDIIVTPYSIDHSAYDAYMFLIETPDKVILHTGDFRLHGYRGPKTISLIKKYIKKYGKRKIDILITEGTMLSRKDEKYYGERDMLKDAKQLMKKYKYVFVLCSSTNLDSLATFYQAGQSQKPKRKIFVTSYFYNILQIFSETAGQKSSLYNFKEKEHVSFNSKLKLANGKTITQEERMKKFGFVALIKEKEEYEKWIERFSNCDGKSKVIYSRWEGYLKKGNKVYDEKLANFCKKYNAIHLHTSGHVYPQDLEKVIKTVCPREAIIPIHTENAEGIKELDLPDYLKKKIKLNIKEYECMSDSRKVSNEMMNELKYGKFSEFVKFIKENHNEKLALCFRGNGQDSVIIYYNNHKVWELIKKNDDYIVKISFDHARYYNKWKDNLEKLCKKYHFIGANNKNIDLDNPIKKNKKGNNSFEYTIGYLIAKNEKYDRKFVSETYEILISMIKKYFTEDNIDYFKSDYEGEIIRNERKHGFIEKIEQQELYFELDKSKDGIYIYDLEFAQKTLPGKKKIGNQPDMHAIRFDKNGKPDKFVVIEVKSTESAMINKKSGFRKHLVEMEKYIYENKDLVEDRLKEAYEIISQYQDLELRKVKNFDKEHDLKLYTSIKKVEIRFILTGEAVEYYNKNKNSLRVKGLQKHEKYALEQGYKIDVCTNKRIEFFKEIKI